MPIWVDADACPAEIKDLLFRMSQRRNIPVCLVANRQMYTPPSSQVTFVYVPKEPDAADHYIVQHVAPNDIVITADIPLAAAAVDKKAQVISPRGEVFTADNVHERLAVRNLMQDLRSSGLVQGGPAPFKAQDRQKFADALDRAITKGERTTK
ncbi:MAG: hypothetical protein ETSY1_39685 [Candidatus Entotheonella factor]|uniref:UPF0178 protein ETSY1_39685 n=1 Tax=Entotheonella factor TaxID=1429438 RepID=W4L5I3_ENTF1|nr:YaiI/YqxD family protein [Candidatus Entotheonella palauensis]ETW93338.1 MAG: hypothetical protein ETSY1_39685 [Candidatus Entotheonella factor]